MLTDGRTYTTKLRVTFRDFTTRLQTIQRSRKEITLFRRAFARIYLCHSTVLSYIFCSFLALLFSRILIKETSETVHWQKHFGLGDIIEGVRIKYKNGQRYIRLYCSYSRHPENIFTQFFCTHPSSGQIISQRTHPLGPLIDPMLLILF